VSGVVLGEILYCEVDSTTATYRKTRADFPHGWVTFTAEGTGVYLQSWKMDSSWEYTRSGLYLERGKSRSFYISSGQISYYIPTGGTLRIEYVKPYDPYRSAPTEKV
jgi:hypothetical protein